jgi:hypothetical protein
MAWFGVAFASLEEQAYTGLQERDRELESRFALRESAAGLPNHRNGLAVTAG